jgi:hypothetical protein
LEVYKVCGVKELLKNRPQEQVAAETEVSGPVPSPRADTWKIEIVGTLIQNAFFKPSCRGWEKGMARPKERARGYASEADALYQRMCF